MKESFKKYWNLYLAFILLILGMFFYGRSYGFEPYAYNYEGKVYFFEHPLAIQNK
ncbi:hypothetical protein BN1013_02120 [Candidatus Rubidus massiliensis]|nr:hypothetical protein BN1013_02120 [Candidatus Rubidus massiliensis]